MQRKGSSALGRYEASLNRLAGCQTTVVSFISNASLSGL
ncbi:hypothetical protein AmDm5_3126 [Acetobacter malorum]|nr:hypothetical protein AmDm5_3126 [Acetobacter malorum]